QTDVYDRKPDLIVLEIPLINMVSANSNMDSILNSLQDFVWGDRAGAINANSFKSRSNNWADFEVLLIIPQHTRADFNADSTFATKPSGYTAEELFNAVKSFIYTKGD